MKKSYSRVLTALVGILCVAVGMQLIPHRSDPYFVPKGALKDLVPAHVAGWSSRDEPLGETEFMEDRVRDILGFEDAFFRIYQRGPAQVGLYVAYWKPGMIHPIEAATHSPDLCWVNAGWRSQDENYALHLEDGEGRPLRIAQFREFTNGTQRQEVVFWHLMGGALSGYALGPSSRWKARLPVLWENQLNTRFGFVRREQIFIRISTNQRIDDLIKDPLWAEIIRGLGSTGLTEKGDTNS